TTDLDPGIQAVAVVELDQHNGPDLVVANTTTGAIQILLNDGQNKFTVGDPIPLSAGLQSLASGDFNGDGKTDIAVTNDKDNTVNVLLGDGQGGFGDPIPLQGALFTSPQGILAADFTGDGRPDLVAADSGDITVTVYSTVKSIDAVDVAVSPPII